jgi:hypothetical protein
MSGIKVKIQAFNERVKAVIPTKYAFILSIIFFITGLTLYHKYVGSFDHIQDRPSSIHVWAQCARASIALNYARTDMNFFKPHIHKYLDGDGTTGLEFPLVNYVPAICYKLFGFNEGYYRGFVLLSISIGLLFFFLMINQKLHNWLISFGLTLSAYCSPVFAYYSINFMPDITSVALALIAWYFFFKYARADVPKRSHLVWFCVCATLAALIKISSLVVILTVFALIVLDYLKFFKNVKNGIVFNNKPKLILALLGCIGTVLSWYMYSAYLVKNGGADSFAMITMRVTDVETFNEVWNGIKKDHTYEYYPYETYMLLIAALAILIIGAKWVDRFLFTTAFITTLGNLSVVYFFFYQFKNHDYYFIPLTTSIFLLYYTFADLLRKIQLKWLPALSAIFIIILFFNLKESVVYTKKIFSMRFEREFVPYFDDTAPYNDLEPKLRKLGIKRTDRTIVAFDSHWCGGLYKMDQLGFTLEAEVSRESFDALLNRKKFKYMVLSDSVRFNKMYPNNFQNKIIGSHRGLLIYKLGN